ncbi:hypothetical protein LIER_37606 [Lithospermum erythrorhizon]|uniref:Uncharacterized protein n=1 Tax=Lithospermum erythrorhizon TaxID=34254 RepID=A0AAV3PRP4_LITER
MHKMAIANLVPTSNNANVSEEVGRMIILIHQHPEILKAGDGSGEDAKPLTITDKLISGKRIVDVEIKGAEKPTAAPEGEAVAPVDQALKVTVPPIVHDTVPADTADPEIIPPTVNDLASDAADETIRSHV